jgi:hypothetical protein
MSFPQQFAHKQVAHPEFADDGFLWATLSSNAASDYFSPTIIDETNSTILSGSTESDDRRVRCQYDVTMDDKANPMNCEGLFDNDAKLENNEQGYATDTLSSVTCSIYLTSDESKASRSSPSDEEDQQSKSDYPVTLADFKSTVIFPEAPTVSDTTPIRSGITYEESKPDPVIVDSAEANLAETKSSDLEIVSVEPLTLVHVQRASGCCQQICGTLQRIQVWLGLPFGRRRVAEDGDDGSVPDLIPHHEDNVLVPDNPETNVFIHSTCLFPSADVRCKVISTDNNLVKLKWVDHENDLDVPLTTYHGPAGLHNMIVIGLYEPQSEFAFTVMLNGIRLDLQKSVDQKQMIVYPTSLFYSQRKGCKMFKLVPCVSVPEFILCINDAIRDGNKVLSSENRKKWKLAFVCSLVERLSNNMFTVVKDRRLGARIVRSTKGKHIMHNMETEAHRPFGPVGEGVKN